MFFHCPQQIITLPITIPGAKPGDMQQQTLQIQVVNPHASNNQSIPFSLQQFGQVLLYNQQNEGLQLQVVVDTRDRSLASYFRITLDCFNESDYLITLITRETVFFCTFNGLIL